MRVCVFLISAHVQALSRCRIRMAAARDKKDKCMHLVIKDVEGRGANVYVFAIRFLKFEMVRAWQLPMS